MGPAGVGWSFLLAGQTLSRPNTSSLQRIAVLSMLTVFSKYRRSKGD